MTKKVILVGLDDSQESFYSLEWTVEHLLQPSSSSSSSSSSSQSPFKLVLLHVKVPALSLLGFTGPGDILPMVEADLSRAATTVREKAKEFCHSKSVTDFEVEVCEGDARNVLCEAVEKHHADMLVVGSHGYGAFKRVILGSVSDYCAHHAHCSVLIVKKPKIKA